MTALIAVALAGAAPLCGWCAAGLGHTGLVQQQGVRPRAREGRYVVPLPLQTGGVPVSGAFEVVMKDVSVAEAAGYRERVLSAPGWAWLLREFDDDSMTFVVARTAPIPAARRHARRQTHRLMVATVAYRVRRGGGAERLLDTEEVIEQARLHLERIRAGLSDRQLRLLLGRPLATVLGAAPDQVSLKYPGCWIREDQGRVRQVDVMP